MKLPRRTFLHLAAGAAALPLVSRMARAQALPTAIAKSVFTPAEFSRVRSRANCQSSSRPNLKCPST